MVDRGNIDGRGSGQRRSQGADATHRTLTELLEAGIDVRASREEIRAVLRPVCQEARRSQTDIADLVKAVKASFAASDLSSRLLDSGERQQTLDRIVSVCIEEYYASR